MEIEVKEYYNSNMNGEKEYTVEPDWDFIKVLAKSLPKLKYTNRFIPDVIEKFVISAGLLFPDCYLPGGKNRHGEFGEIDPYIFYWGLHEGVFSGYEYMGLEDDSDTDGVLVSNPSEEEWVLKNLNVRALLNTIDNFYIHKENAINELFSLEKQKKVLADYILQRSKFLDRVEFVITDLLFNKSFVDFSSVLFLRVCIALAIDGNITINNLKIGFDKDYSIQKVEPFYSLEITINSSLAEGVNPYLNNLKDIEYSFNEKFLSFDVGSGKYKHGIITGIVPVGTQRYSIMSKLIEAPSYILSYKEISALVYAKPREVSPSMKRDIQGIIKVLRKDLKLSKDSSIDIKAITNEGYQLIY